MMHIGRSQMDAHTRAFENVLLQEAYIFIPLVWGSIGIHFGSVRETSSQPTSLLLDTSSVHTIMFEALTRAKKPSTEGQK